MTQADPPAMNKSTRTPYRTVLWRAWRLRCPQCGHDRLFKNWISMHSRCETCGLKYEREPGYFLGSIYVNYGLTALLVTVLYLGLLFSEVVSPESALWVAAGVAMVFPLWFFRYARSIWLGFDHYWDPQTRQS
jgi:uncharacterized protein (DUF983 family)